MKNWFIVLITVIVVAFAIVGCFDTEGDIDNQGSGGATTSGESTSGSSSSKSNLGDYNVVIKSFRLASDYEDKPIIIITYTFSNYADEAQCFSWSVNAKAYQDGVGLNESYFVNDDANYSSDNQTKEIKTGKSLDVEVAYELNDDTTDVEVEVSELISFSDRKVIKTFKLA
jgi:hypothetical protein